MAATTANTAAITNTATTATTSAVTAHQTLAAAATAPPTTPPLDEGTVSRMRSLSGEQRVWRLIQAARQGAVWELRALLAVGADVGAMGGGGWTALHWTAWEGHVETARCLLEAGAPVDAWDGGLKRTPLFCAAQRGHAAVTQLLLSASADPNFKDVDGWTPLHFAAHGGSPEVAAALLEAGADQETRNDDGDTALDIARQCNRRRLIEMLSSGSQSKKLPLQ
ncbi:poly [ADP-ribose] polymerase tankyrase-1-like [Schistocerca americana]|uniref:poly [ADP-ribose] polymerase tankyrase-1-like n=1 Tax=Schistocerca americana TaxID=7009 RepID=UPI001F4FF19D|nr:poly [ADP-ribose] polymerase tankyrase-1-like [Schistocerca americana]